MILAIVSYAVNVPGEAKGPTLTRAVDNHASPPYAPGGGGGGGGQDLHHTFNYHCKN